jgi:hypothetical protein
MFELQELRKRIEQQDYQGALQIVTELEEMSLDDKLNKIESYMVILLLHLIKQQAEKRTTSSWNRSIANSVRGINKTNKRRRAGGYYAKPQQIASMLESVFDEALEEASYEAFEGRLDNIEVEAKIDRQQIIQQANYLINKQI